MIITNKNKIVLNKGVMVNKFSMDDMTIAFISGLTTKPNTAHIKLIDTFIKQTKSILQDKADVVYLGNINNSNDSFRNLVKDAHHGTVEGSGLVFDPYWGFSNPDGTGYVDTNYNPATQGVNYILNDAGVSVYLGSTIPLTTEYYILGCKDISGTRYLLLRTSNIANQNGFIVNNSGSLNVPNLPFRSGLHFGERNTSTTLRYRNQNIVTNVISANSVSIPNNNVFLWRSNGVVGSNYLGNISFTYIGASLTDAEFTLLNNAVNDYLIQCLFLKYGHDNWGVKMAKSYFLELHNFEKYEAFEVYEFIKRHQPDYQDLNLIPLDSSKFNSSGGTSWWQVGNGTISYNSTDKCLELNSVTTGYLYKTSSSLFNNAAIGYRVKFKYRSATYTNKLLVYFDTYSATFTNNCLSQWQQYDSYITGVPSTFYIVVALQHNGIIELDDIEIIPEGYYYKQFSGNTIANHIMVFKAGGDLLTNTWTKTGTLLRWNQDGIVSCVNNMPSYTRGSNLGIVTVTSEDGWNGVTAINNVQTSSSVNRFYGNYPNFYSTLKTSGAKCYIYAYYNSCKFELRNQNLKDLCLGIHTSVTYPGGVRTNISDYIGGNYTYYVRNNGSLFIPWSKVSGDVTTITNEFQNFLDFSYDDSIVGSLRNLVISNRLTCIFFVNTSISEGTNVWNKYIAIFTLNNSKLPTSAVDAQLKVINDYFAINTPIKNVTINLAGTRMGIPTGGSSNVDLLGIISKHTAAGFTATITVRTV